MTPKMLKTALPTMVPMPKSLLVTKVPMMLVNNSGAEEPAAIKVAPATSLDMCNVSQIFSNTGTKKSSQMAPKAKIRYVAMSMWTMMPP